jgi:hypothetical protein
VGTSQAIIGIFIALISCGFGVMLGGMIDDGAEKLANRHVCGSSPAEDKDDVAVGPSEA